MEIRPFRVAIAQESLDDLRSRLDRIRWTSDIPGEGPDYGMSLAWVQRLAGYWRDGFDWRAAEARLNAFPQFITEHRRPGHLLPARQVAGAGRLAADPDARLARFGGGVPRVIGPLTDPRAHDRDPSTRSTW
jgi:Epoxide hydrolase N terminus.